ncbi:head protein [Burkholderia phage vB_BglM_WTB]
MRIPGSNLLKQAGRLIKLVGVPYIQANGRELNAAKQWVTSYLEPVTVKMSVQRVPRSKYIQFNLELQRNYIMLFASLDMIDLDRDASGDRLIWNGRLYQIESQNTWFAQDGWAKSLAVDIGPAPVLPPAPEPEAP